MNRITRCPSCTTVYQLGDAQLQAAKGWLRCGVCSHVFDSTGLVLRWSPAPAEPSRSPELPQPDAPDAGALSTTQALQAPDLVVDPAERIALDDFLKKRKTTTRLFKHGTRKPSWPLLRVLCPVSSLSPG